MKIEWINKSIKPEVLLDRLRSIATVDTEGRVTFGGFEKFELDSVLFSMIDFHRNYSHSTSRAFYTAALNSWILNGDGGANQFMGELNKLTISYAQKPLQSYIAITSISIDSGFVVRRTKLAESTMECFPKGLPKKYNNRSEFNGLWKESGAPMPSHYCPVAIRFKSRSPTDGMEFALDELDYVRGLHALTLNSAYTANLGGGPGSRLPINCIMLGGIHTLHHPSGKSASAGMYWYEAEYNEIKAVSIDDSKRVSARKYVEWLRRGIAQHKDGHVLKDSIIRYVRAFDGKDKNYTLQKTWAALESILASGDKNTDFVVRRCSYLYSERNYHRQVLEHLKSYRNRSVHSGKTLDNPNDHCYQIQQYFRQTINFHVANATIFKDLREGNEFLDLPDSIKELERRRFLLDKATKFLSG